MRSLILVAVAALAGCTEPPPAAPNTAFAQELAGHVPGKPESCVTSYPAENLRIVDQSTIAYGSGRTIYVNHLGGPCPALSQFNTIIVDAGIGGQYCRGDHVRGLEPGAIIAGPQCNLGDWIPYRMP
jgi:hypothetical protein